MKSYMKKIATILTGKFAFLFLLTQK